MTTNCEVVVEATSVISPDIDFQDAPPVVLYTFTTWSVVLKYNWPCIPPAGSPAVSWFSRTKVSAWFWLKSKLFLNSIAMFV